MLGAVRHRPQRLVSSAQTRRCHPSRLPLGVMEASVWDCTYGAPGQTGDDGRVRVSSRLELVDRPCGLALEEREDLDHGSRGQDTIGAHVTRGGAEPMKRSSDRTSPPHGQPARPADLTACWSRWTPAPSQTRPFTARVRRRWATSFAKQLEVGVDVVNAASRARSLLDLVRHRLTGSRAKSGGRRADWPRLPGRRRASGSRRLRARTCNARSSGRTARRYRRTRES